LESDCDQLKSMFGPVHKFFPYAIGDGERATFYRCNHTMTSSLLKPDLEIMGLYQNLPEFCQVVDVSEIATVRLDDVPEALGADYLKLDVQGAEGRVLAGARTCLDSVVAVHTELEFVPIYEGQPLFADIDAILRSRGFMLHRLLNPEGPCSAIAGSSTTRKLEANTFGGMPCIFVRQPAGILCRATGS
jgi:FkbM family methyltransferase